MRYLCSFLALSFIFIGCTDKTPPPPPNIILVLVDDLGWSDLSCQGSSFYRTPNIDKLAAEGIRFTNAYAACAVCSPSRAAIQTGRYPVRHGITDWIRSRFQGGDIPENKQNPNGYVDPPEFGRLYTPENALWMEKEEQSLAELLKGQGYHTGFIGKWHLGTDDWYPDQQGYDENHGGCDYGQPPHYFDPYKRPDHPHPMIQAGIPTLAPRDSGEYLTDREAFEAVSFIERNKEKPFFLSLAHYAVHTPIQAKDDLKALYEPTEDSLGTAEYAAMVHSVDDAMGSILGALEESGLRENTLIIFTSDNGGLDRNGNPTNNTPLRSGKGFPHEGGVRVPFIVSWPAAVPTNLSSDEPVMGIDVFPTLAEVTQSQPLQEIDGVSLATYLKQPEQESLNRETLFWHFPHYRYKQVGPYSIVRKDKWKMIKFYEEETVELYDLENDLSEKFELSSEHPDIVKELESSLADWLASTQAKTPKLTL
ncbi:MAG: sulfatase [Bacteroidota bacterium]